MRTQIIPEVSTVTYPDKWCFARDCNRITVETALFRSVTIVITDVRQPFKVYEYSAAVYDEEAVIYLDDILPIFADVEFDKRWTTIHVAVKGDSVAIASFHLVVLFGGVRKGEYKSMLMTSEETGVPYVERRVTRFVNFPFTVTLFRRDISDPIWCSQGGGTETKRQYDGVNLFDVDITNTRPLPMVFRTEKTAFDLILFDNTFDESYIEPFGDMINEKLFVDLDYRTEGYYIRWVDNFGYSQYYLFEPSDVTVNTESCKYDKCNIADFITYRTIGESVSTKVKCSATCLTPALFRTVSSIISSSRVEMLTGDYWTPIEVSNQSATVKQDFELTDFEITLNIKHQYQQLL